MMSAYKQGQIYFWNDKGESLFGKAITYYNKRTFPNNEWLPTHCGIITKIIDNEHILIHEAGPKGFSSSTYPMAWLDEKIEQGYCQIGECNEKLVDVFENAEKYVGIGYGWLDILTIAFSLFTGFRLGLTGNNKIICSEAVNYVIYDSTKKVNFAAEYEISPDAVTPAHIYLSKQTKIL